MADTGGEALGARLAACADRIAALDEAIEAEHRRRDEMIVQMRDTGSTWQAIGKAARLSVSRCVAIVTGGA